MDWTSIIPAAINFIANLIKRKRRLIVHITRGFTVRGQEINRDLIVIQVTNRGSKTVTIDCPYIEFPDGRPFILINPGSDVVQFPHPLREETYCHIRIRIQDIINRANELGYSGAIKLKAKVVDGIGKRYNSKTTLELNLDEEIG